MGVLVALEGVLLVPLVLNCDLIASKFFPDIVLDTTGFGGGGVEDEATFGLDGEFAVGVEDDELFSNREIRSEMGLLPI